MSRVTEFLVRVELPSRATWLRDPQQVAFTVKNVVQSWIEQSVSKKPTVTVSILLPKTNLPRPITAAAELREQNNAKLPTSESDDNNQSTTAAAAPDVKPG